MSKKDLKISCVIPTYNRCPHKGDSIRYNPLWWSVNSLFSESDISEVILVNDCSDDYFDATISALKQRSPSHIQIRDINNREREGSGVSRNIGVDMASNELIFFYDDDCVFASKGMIKNLKFAFESEENIAAMSLPVSGNSFKSPLYPSSKIGRVDRETGILYGCYTKFPLEYVGGDGEVSEHYILNESKRIVKPLKVELMGGVFLCNKEFFMRAGGFPRTKWRNSCAEEPELILNMQKKGYKVFYLPSMNRRFRVYHLRYGDPSYSRDISDESFRLDNVSLEEIIRKSSEKRQINHGNRVNKRDELYSNILSNLRLLFKYKDIFGENVGYNHLKERYRENVKYPDRIQIFKKAVSDGVELMLEENIINDQIAKKIEKEFLIN